MKYLNDDGLLYLVQKIKAWLNGKVDKVDGKGLSTNDYTSAEKTKLSGIEANATKTIVNNTLTSTSTTEALSAYQGKVLDEKIKAINTGMEDLGAGDMLKSVYDTNNNGKVDDSDKLGGQLPSYYAKASAIPTVPTNVGAFTNDKNYQTEAQVKALVEGIIGAAPDALNTLDELAQALGDDPNFAATITTELGKKVNTTDLSVITNAEIDTIVSG